VWSFVADYHEVQRGLANCQSKWDFTIGHSAAVML
jgi:hypothetical protein